MQPVWDELNLDVVTPGLEPGEWHFTPHSPDEAAILSAAASI
jgi:hypothetical protein